jgi:hypothetical protein
MPTRARALALDAAAPHLGFAPTRAHRRPAPARFSLVSPTAPRATSGSTRLVDVLAALERRRRRALIAARRAVGE